jgi:hypothetical protein
VELIYKKEKNISRRIKEIRFSAKGDANDVGEDSPSDSEENPEDSTEVSKEPLEDKSEGDVQNEDKKEELSDLSDVPEDSSKKDDDFEYLREQDPTNDKKDEDFEYLKESDSFNKSKDSGDFDYLRESDPLENSEDPNDFDFLKETDPIKEENSGDSDYLREEESNLDGEDDNDDYDYLREDGSEGLESNEENQKSDLKDGINSDVEEDPEQENEREALDNLTKELEEAKDSIYAGDLLVSRSDAERMRDEGFEDFLNRDDHDKDEIEDYNEYLKYRDKLNDSAGENKETDEESDSTLEKNDTNESIDDHKKDTKMHDPFTSKSDEEGEEPVLHGSRSQYTVQEVVKKESEQESFQDQKNEENEAREEIKEKNDLNKNKEEPSDSDKEEETIKDKKQNDSEEKFEENQEQEEIEKESNDFHKKERRDTEAVKESSDDLQERKRLKEVEEVAEEELKKKDNIEEKKHLEEYAEEYRSETEGKRPFYANKMTKDFEKWLKKKKLEEERLKKEKEKQALKKSKEKKLLDDTSGSKNDKKESQAYDKDHETNIENITEKEVEKKAEKDLEKEVNSDVKVDKDEKEHPWSKLLKNWIDEEQSEKATKKSKKELKRIIDKFLETKKKHERYQWLIKKLVKKRISKSEYEELKKLEGELENLTLKETELFKNLVAFKKFYEDNRFWYKSNIKKARKKFTKFLFQKLENLNEYEKNGKTKIKPKRLKEAHQKLGRKKKLDENIDIHNKMNDKAQIKADLNEMGVIKTHSVAKNKTSNKTDIEQDKVIGKNFEIVKGDYKWSELLKNWIEEVKSEKISDNSRKKLMNIVDKFNEMTKKHSHIQELLKKSREGRISNVKLKELEKLSKDLDFSDRLGREIFKNLAAFRKFYENNIDWYPSNIKKAKEKFNKFLFKKLEDLKDFAGNNEKVEDKLIKKNMQKFGFLLEEIEFLKDQSINIDNLKSKWSWLYENPQLIESYFVKIILPYYIEKPEITNSEIKKLGFNAFINALKRGRAKGKFKITFGQLKAHFKNKDFSFLIKTFGSKEARKMIYKARKRILENLENFVSKRSINLYKRKLKALSYLFSTIKCEECDCDITYLPVLELHHIEGKKYSLPDFYEGKCGLEELKRENTLLMCSNHHSKEQVKYIDLFKNIVFNKKLFKLSAKQIDDFIDLKLEEFKNSERYLNFLRENYYSQGKEVPDKILIKLKYQIKIWIKKYYVFNLLFEGKCICCGYNDLAALDLHHRSEEKEASEGSFWQSISNNKIKEIIVKIIEDDCVLICSNCHRFYHSSFHKCYEEVLGSYLSEEEFDKYSEIINNSYDLIKNKIKNYKFRKNTINLTEFSLELPFDNENKWREHILEIYFYLKKSFNDYFFLRDFSKVLNYDDWPSRKFINKLIDEGFVVKSNPYHLSRYSLSDKGTIICEKLISKYPKKASEIKNKIYINYSDILDLTPNELDTYDDIIFKYPMYINKVINTKGINEFTSQDLLPYTKTEPSIVNVHLRNKLLPHKLIGIVKNPKFSMSDSQISVFKYLQKQEDYISTDNVCKVLPNIKRRTILYSLNKMVKKGIVKKKILKEGDFWKCNDKFKTINIDHVASNYNVKTYYLTKYGFKKLEEFYKMKKFYEDRK